MKKPPAGPNVEETQGSQELQAVREEEAGGGAEGGAAQDSPFSRVCRLARTRKKVWEKIPGKCKKEKRASARPRVPTPAPAPAPAPGPHLPRPKQPVNKPTSSLPPAPLLRRPLRAFGIAAGGCSSGTPWPPRSAAPAPASGAPGPAAARPARAAMRADSPRLPGGGGTSAPNGGGGHVGLDHVTRRRRAPGVKVQEVVGAAGPGPGNSGSHSGSNRLRPPWGPSHRPQSQPAQVLVAARSSHPTPRPLPARGSFRPGTPPGSRLPRGYPFAGEIA